MGAALQTATLPSRWATSAFARQAVTVLVLGSAALAAGALARGTTDGVSPLAQLRELKRSVTAKSAAAFPSQPSPFVVDSRGIAAVAPTESSLNSLRDPGYLLARSTATAIADVRVAVADAALLQQLRTQILAPAVPAGLSGGALTDLVSLVRQAQVSSSAAQAAAAKPLDPLALAQAQTAVRAAQQELAQATRARDEAESNALSAALPAGSPAGTTPDVGALTRVLESRLAVAQQRVQTMLIAPSPDVVTAAQKAVAFALAATPPAPDEQRIAEAKSAVEVAQKQFDAASQPPSAAAMANARADAEGRGTPTTSSARGQTVPAPVADPGEKPLDAMSRIARGPDPQRVADTKINLDNAKVALAALEQQAAYASSPEIQPIVVDARNRLAALLAPPDPAVVAEAQAAVVAIQQQLETVRRVASSGGAAATATTSSVAVAGTATSTPSNDPVSQARQRLIDAQARLRAVVVPPSDGAATSDESGLPAGSTSTRVTPEILAAQNRLASTLSVNRNDLTAVQIELRARYVSDIALRAAHLHPAALSSSSQSRRADGIASPVLGWPVLGTVTQPFGVPELGVGAPHTGVDIGVTVGTPVLAAASGVISFAGGAPGVGYGYYAIVEHGLGVTTLYAHLALPPFMHVGQLVAQGGLLGLSGSTGVSTGPHLHFELRYNGSPVDPLRALPPTGR